MNAEELKVEEHFVTPQERTGIKLLALFEPEIWLVVDGSYLPSQNSAGAGVVILKRLSQQEKQSEANFSIDWQHYSYPLENCSNSTEAEILAAIKGLELVASMAGQKRIHLISDHYTVSTLPTQLLVIELGLKNAKRYTKEMEKPPLRELADLYLQLQPCQILSLQDIQPEGFNLLLLASHQATHKLAAKATMSISSNS
ncbi:MAG: reverse transcriptase-like protein [Coleofasciculus sp. B1-GNL1-01]|uniref:reverse transcriptase-like protein n=1 Tax=Coleofasciculus sp. B1-GNL1-01 TaxID=3068484 RepID=UPI0032FA40D9